MKAIVMTSPGTPEVLKAQEVPELVIKKHTEILVHLQGKLFCNAIN